MYCEFIVEYLKNLDLGFYGIKIYKKVFDSSEVLYILDEVYRNLLIE